MLTATKPVMTTLTALGVFSRTEQRVLQAIFKAIVDGDGCCVATLATLARASNTSRTTTRNAIVIAVAIGMLEETEHGSYKLGSQAGTGSPQAGRRGNRWAPIPH
jgi:DNA-binding IclR family transcriptional regulator